MRRGRHVLVKNLVDNAIRYTSAGGRVDLSVTQNNGTIELAIEDNGPGIPQNELARVFDPFYRVLGSDKIGAGFGLSIVQAIAKRIGAQVSLGFADTKWMTGLRASVCFLPLQQKCSQEH